MFHANSVSSRIEMSFSLEELCALVNVPYDETLEAKVFSDEDEEEDEKEGEEVRRKEIVLGCLETSCEEQGL